MITDLDLCALEERLRRMDKVHSPTVVLGLPELAALIAEVRRLREKEGKQ